MKTCSFRGAQPRSLVEGIFCNQNEPEIKYRMRRCSDMPCASCFPRYQWEKTQPWLIIDFDASSSHRFINGYTTYLNCPVVGRIILRCLFS